MNAMFPSGYKYMTRPIRAVLPLKVRDTFPAVLRRPPSSRKINLKHINT